MILLDTNLISEPLRPAPEPAVLAWIDAQPLETLFLSAISVAELRIGIAAMAAGKRRDILRERIETQVLPVFSGRILPFDMAATQPCADLLAKAKSKGYAIALSDAWIAAIALTHGMSVATRDVEPFRIAGCAVVNPWP
ncbi:MAG: type II toxin-antitoxin system VapC family toxin [Lysobacteraceae bacterium]